MCISSFSHPPHFNCESTDFELSCCAVQFHIDFYHGLSVFGQHFQQHFLVPSIAIQPFHGLLSTLFLKTSLLYLCFPALTGEVFLPCRCVVRVCVFQMLVRSFAFLSSFKTIQKRQPDRTLDMFHSLSPIFFFCFHFRWNFCFSFSIPCFQFHVFSNPTLTQPPAAVLRSYVLLFMSIDFLVFLF